MSEYETYSSLRWFFKGSKILLTLPSLVLTCALLGFAGFAIEAGLDLPQTVFINGVIWALPSQLILVSSIISGATILTTIIAVSLASMRFVPMVAALIPEIRTKHTPIWLLLLVSHFVAITAWVYTFEKMKQVPREHRLAFLAGVGTSLTVFNSILISIAYPFIEILPPMALGSLFFLTPIYFLFSLWRNARDYSVYLAMGFGSILGPLVAPFIPQIDVLVAGFVGGTIATLIYVAREKRRQTNDL